MKRTRIDIEAVADFGSLVAAAHLAARGKWHRPCVQGFFQDVDGHINALSRDILAGRMPVGHYRTFQIQDPKRRVIHAACFCDRVFHHALMAHAAPVLERAMVPTTYACLPGRGPLAAVERVRHCLQRHPWYVKIDIRKFFDTIDHQMLAGLLRRRFKGERFLAAVDRIIEGFATTPGKGLPIGSLTSQHFANYYLDGLDRYLLEQLRVRGHARYMDDVIWWCGSRPEAKATLLAVEGYLRQERALELTRPGQINRSDRGVAYCGFRVFPDALRLGKRRRRRYSERRRYWEGQYLAGQIDSGKLQSAYAAVHAITAHAAGQGRRRENLRRCPPPADA